MNNLISLIKTAKISLQKQNLIGINAKVVLVLDISKSMHPLYKNGTVQKTVERLLALAINFDPEKQIDAYVFGTEAHQLKAITENDINNYVTREIIAKHKINQATYYAKAIELIQANYYGKRKLPVFVIFITDGDATDKTATKAWLQQICKEPIFWQFIGIGKEKFNFLETLDTLTGRSIDNAAFIKIDNLDTIPESELYDNLLKEYPNWLTIMQQKKIISD